MISAGLATRFDARDSPEKIARLMREGVLNGYDDADLKPSAIGSTRAIVRRLDCSLLVVLFSRDVGYHTSGWWKNPDYERCEHLSMSLQAPPEGLPLPPRLVREWTTAFFGDSTRLIWEEGPFSMKGKALGVHHYRVFCDPEWEPILPRREVYSRELTEAGWKSWSDRADAEGEATRLLTERGESR